jgi:hypothetical protein
MTLRHFVDLYELNQEAKPVKIATFWITEDDPSNVQMEGDERHPILRNLYFEGIFDYKNAQPRKLFPYDGMIFLENLRYYFKSAYFWATDVQQKIIDN